MKDALKTTLWGVGWIVGAFGFLFYSFGSPIDDLRLMLSATTTQGHIVDTWEDAEDGDDGRLHWSSAVVYTFTLPDGREIKSVSKGNSRLPAEWADLKSPIPIEIEYVSSRPSISRLSGDGSQSFVGWLWRTALGGLLLALLLSPGVKLLQDGVPELRAAFRNRRNTTRPV